MSKLTAEFVQKALDNYSVWDLGNQVLYRLCRDHPGHTECNVIIAKVWLIGRSYAVSVERRHKETIRGDAFYDQHLAPKIKSENIDAWFQC